MSNSCDYLDPNRTYDWRVTIAGPIGDGRYAEQEHWGLYRVPAGRQMRVADLMEQLRKECAAKMHIPASSATVRTFTVSA